MCDVNIMSESRPLAEDARCYSDVLEELPSNSDDKPSYFNSFARNNLYCHRSFFLSVLVLFLDVLQRLRLKSCLCRVPHRSQSRCLWSLLFVLRDVAGTSFQGVSRVLCVAATRKNKPSRTAADNIWKCHAPHESLMEHKCLTPDYECGLDVCDLGFQEKVCEPLSFLFGVGAPVTPTRVKPDAVRQ